MTIPITISTLSPTTPKRQSLPTAPEAVALPARPDAALAPPLIPLLDLLADLIARDVLAQCSESDASLEPEAGQAVTGAMISPVNREGGTSRSDSQIPTNFSANVPLNSHHHPHTDDPVITKEKKL